MEGVFRVVEDLCLLLEPLIQGLEIQFHVPCKLGVEPLRDDQRVDRSPPQGELRGGGLDPGDGGPGGEGRGGEERGARDPVLWEPFVFPDKEGGGGVEEGGAGEGAAEAFLGGEDLRVVGRVGVEELAGEGGDSGRGGLGEGGWEEIGG